MSTRINIRPATIADCAVLANIDTETNPHPWGEQRFIDTLNHHLQHTYIAEHQNHIIGFAIWQTLAGESELHLIAVEPHNQRHGWGSHLLNTWLTHGQHQQVNQYFLEVRESNHAAIALYQKHGFTESYRRPGYYPLPNGNTEAAIIMEKSC